MTAKSGLGASSKQLLSDLADPASTIKGRQKFLNALESLGELPLSDENGDLIAKAIQGDEKTPSVLQRLSALLADGKNIEKKHHDRSVSGLAVYALGRITAMNPRLRLYAVESARAHSFG